VANFDGFANQSAAGEPGEAIAGLALASTDIFRYVYVSQNSLAEFP
jgi:hypothetical protein